MDIRVFAKCNVKYQGKIIPAGTVLSVPKETLSELAAFFMSVEEAEKQEAQAHMTIKSGVAEQHFKMKEKMLESEKIRRENQALLLEKQAEEQSRLAKASAARLRVKQKEGS